MAGMQRFVTYLYSYKGNEKLHNTGFAKIEIRGEQCRLEIHLKGTGLGNETFPIYLFARENGSIQAVEIGNMNFQVGNGDYKGIFKNAGIGHSPYCIQDMSGILILVNDTYMFASHWDEKTILRKSIKIWEPKIEIVPEVRKEPQIQIIPQQMAQLEEVPRASQSEMPKESSEQPETETPVEELGQPEVETPSEEPSQSEAIMSAASTTDEPTEEILEDSSEDLSDDVSDDVLEEMPEKELNNQPEDDTVRTESVRATEIPMRQFFYNYNRPERVKREESLSECFLRLQKKEQTVEIFESGDRQVSGIHIELRDIRELPKRFWYLGNNSFLLHGFFNYRYLLLGKKVVDGEETIFLGVPGVYQSQERVMATLFGFPEFLMEKEEESFGYYCHSIVE